MLEQSDRDYVATNGWIIDHDWELFSCLLGEPFLLGTLLCYWDGAHIAICIWPVERSALKKGLKQRLFGVVEECLERFAPKMIEVWGPQGISLGSVLPPNYVRFAMRLASSDDVDLQIRYPDYKMSKTRKNRHYRHSIKAERDGLVCKISRGSGFKWQHYVLMEGLVNRADVRPADKTYLALAPILTRSERTAVFNAYKDEELVGFIAVREVLQNVAIVVWSSYKRSPLRVSDFLHRKVIEYYQDSGISFLDMGYSVNTNLFQYKLQWEPNVNNGPYYNCAYARNDYVLPGEHWHWWARELLLPVLLPIAKATARETSLIVLKR